MPYRKVPGAPSLALPKRPSFMEDLSRSVLSETDQLTYQRDMVVHHIGMLETELRTARRMLESIDEALRAGKTARIEVTLGIFSGRRDPNWELSEREVEELRRLLDRGLRKSLKERQEPPGLGYRGFVIRNAAGIKDIPKTIEVYKRVIAVIETEHGREKRTNYEDVNRIELWLLEQAGQRGHGDAIKHFGGPNIK